MESNVDDLLERMRDEALGLTTTMAMAERMFALIGVEKTDELAMEAARGLLISLKESMNGEMRAEQAMRMFGHSRDRLASLHINLEFEDMQDLFIELFPEDEDYIRDFGMKVAMVRALGDDLGILLKDLPGLND